MYTDLTAKDAMVREVFTLRPEQDVIEAIETMVKKNMTGAPVINEDGLIVGMFSDTDGIDSVMKMSVDPSFRRRVEDFMTPDPVCVEMNESLIHVAERFLENRFRRYPVVDKGRVVGQVSRLGVLRELTKASRLA